SALRLRRRAALGGLALAAVPLAGCAWNPLNKPATDQSLRVWLSAYRSLDPIQTQSAQEAEYVVQVFSGLTGLNDKLEVVPDLARGVRRRPGQRRQRRAVVDQAERHRAISGPGGEAQREPGAGS